MESLYDVGLDVHKKTVSYCVKTAAGEKVGAGSVAAKKPPCVSAELLVSRLSKLFPVLWPPVQGLSLGFSQPCGIEVRLYGVAKFDYLVRTGRRN